MILPKGGFERLSPPPHHHHQQTHWGTSDLHLNISAFFYISKTCSPSVTLFSTHHITENKTVAVKMNLLQYL
jgi:hypothetical protein